MKVIVYISRILVGTLFVVSGLIKLNDPLGFSYKLEEYFENGALAYRIRDIFAWDTFTLEFLTEYALLLGIAMCLLEVILGFSLLFGTKVKLTLFSLFGLTILFFFLTLHTATCDPFATYSEVHTVEKNTKEHTKMLLDAEENDQLSMVKEEDNTIVFKEELPVQCVTDCGCFGDAMKGSLGRSLTPWESFTKDLVILLLLVPIYFYRKKIALNTGKQDMYLFIFSILLFVFFSWVFNWFFILLFGCVGFIGYMILKQLVSKNSVEWMAIAFILIISCLIMYFTLNYLPIKDYRPFAVAKSIPEQMVLPEDAVQPVYKNVFYYKNKKTNAIEEFDETNYPWDNEDYEFSDRKTILVTAGDEAAISDFSIIANDGNDYTEDFMNEADYLFLLIAYDITKTNLASFEKINTFVEQSNMDGNYFIGLTASTYDNVEKFRHEQQTLFDFYACDATTLKTIIRANPGLLLLKNGKILDKWNTNQLPDYEAVKSTYLTK